MSKASKKQKSWWQRFLISIYLPAIFQGMKVTWKYLFAKKWTVPYPEVKHVVGEGYRGFPELLEHDDGVEKCVACGLCEIACPAYAIHIIPGEYPDKERKDRYPVEFTIDMGRCICCGYCEEACPVEAIAMSKQYELVSGSLDDLVFRREILLSDYNKLNIPKLWENLDKKNDLAHVPLHKNWNWDRSIQPVNSATQTEVKEKKAEQ